MTNKYLLSLNTGASYELDSETPDASFSPATDQVMPCYITSGAFAGIVALSGLSKIKITGARLTNANLTIEGNGAVAAALKMRLSKVSSGSEVGDPFAEFEMNIGKWNRWEKKNITITPDSSADTSLNRPCHLVLDTDSEFHVYDFNVSDDMKGQNVNPILELEIETDSILDASTGLAI
jgi:hypothetical protein